MIRRLLTLCFGVALLAGPNAQAEERRLTISAPGELVDTGFLRHLLPRFSLKNGVPITLVAPDEAAQARFVSGQAAPVFAQGEIVWSLDISPEEAANPHMLKLFDWLAGDNGKRAIEGFAGPPVFTAVAMAVESEQADVLTGDLARGEALSLKHCGRCHVIGPQNAMNGVGSTPSFAVLRTFPDWTERFEAFYALNPHPAFSQVRDVTPPFPEGTTPTTAPVVLTIEELEDITAFAGSVAPADLGAPIRHQ